jgi:hypothetical protein
MIHPQFYCLPMYSLNSDKKPKCKIIIRWHIVLFNSLFKSGKNKSKPKDKLILGGINNSSTY